MNLIKAMFDEWMAEASTPRCAQCTGKGPECKCPDDEFSNSSALSLNPTEAFANYCETFPWASECKIYED
jgi:hypothetical protein